MIANTQRIVKGIWIPIEVWCAGDLNWNEKILLMEISSFTDRERDCYVSNEYIARLLGVNETNASKILSSLIRKGYVEKTRFDGRRRFVRSLLATTMQSCQEEQGRVVASDNPALSPATTDLYKKTNIDYNIPTREDITTEESITNVISSSSVIPSLSGSAREEDLRRRKFTPPTVEQVRDYCDGRGPEYQSIDPEEFVAFYQSKGWMVGKSPMKDWHAALVTWARKRVRGGGRPQESVKAPVEIALEENARTLRRLAERNSKGRMAIEGQGSISVEDGALVLRGGAANE